MSKNEYARQKSKFAKENHCGKNVKCEHTRKKGLLLEYAFLYNRSFHLNHS